MKSIFIRCQHIHLFPEFPFHSRFIILEPPAFFLQRFISIHQFAVLPLQPFVGFLHVPFLRRCLKNFNSQANRKGHKQKDQCDVEGVSTGYGRFYIPGFGRILVHGKSIKLWENLQNMYLSFRYHFRYNFLQFPSARKGLVLIIIVKEDRKF